MIAETVVFLFIETERLLLVTLLHTRHQLIVFTVMRIYTVDGKKILDIATGSWYLFAVSRSGEVL